MLVPRIRPPDFWFLPSIPKGLWISNPCSPPRPPVVKLLLILTFVLRVFLCCTSVGSDLEEQHMHLLWTDPLTLDSRVYQNQWLLYFLKLLYFLNRPYMHMAQKFKKYKSIWLKVKFPLTLASDSLVLIPKVTYTLISFSCIIQGYSMPM